MHYFSENVMFMEITTCCATWSKPRNVIIVDIQSYGLSLKTSQYGWTVSMLRFTTEAQIHGNLRNYIKQGSWFHVVFYVAMITF
jgi:hypothetical protein